MSWFLQGKDTCLAVGNSRGGAAPPSLEGTNRYILLHLPRFKNNELCAKIFKLGDLIKKSSSLASLENLEDVLTLNILVKLAEAGNNFFHEMGYGFSSLPQSPLLLNV